MGEVFCNDCGKELNANEKTCLNCSCQNRTYKKEISVIGEASVSVGWKHKRPSFAGGPIARGVGRLKTSRDGDRVYESWTAVLIYECAYGICILFLPLEGFPLLLLLYQLLWEERL